MRMNGTRRHLTHAAPAHADPANPDADVVVCWDKEEEVLTGLLFLFVTSEVYSQIASDLVFATVHAKYQQLETLYGVVGSMATFNLWVSLANTKLKKVRPSCLNSSICWTRGIPLGRMGWRSPICRCRSFC